MTEGETAFKKRPSHKWMIDNLDKIEVVEWWFLDTAETLQKRFDEIKMMVKENKHPEIVANELNFIVEELLEALQK